MIKLLLENSTDVEVSESLFSEYLEKVVVLVKEATGSVNLIICSDEEIQELNEEYRKKIGPTDVLSFPYWDEIGEETIIGDIYISIDMAKIQANEKSHSLEEELKILFVHGLLHLFGFDHNTDDEEAEMENYAKKLL